jgi:uncharacterized protein involved in exopolysaccharide biosynthesis
MSRNVRLLLIAVVVGAVIGVGYTLIVAPKWRAKSVLLMAQDPTSTSPLSAIGGLQQDPIRIVAGVMQTERAKVAIAEATKIEYDDLDYGVRADPSNGQLTLTYIHRDKAKAAQVVDLLIENLRTIEAEVGLNVADKETKNFLKALDQRKGEVKEVEERLLTFAKNSKTGPNPDKPLAVLDYLRQINALRVERRGVEAQLASVQEGGRRTAAEGANLPVKFNDDLTLWRRKLDEANYELRVLRIAKGDRDPSVQRAQEAVKLAQTELQRQVSNAIRVLNDNLDSEVLDIISRKLIIDSQIAQLEPLASAAPLEGVEYQRLMNQYKLASGALELAATQYETARLKADAAKVRWGVLDKTFIERDPVNKKLSTAVVTWGLLGLVGGIALAAFQEQRKKGK